MHPELFTIFTSSGNKRKRRQNLRDWLLENEILELCYADDIVIIAKDEKTLNMKINLQRSIEIMERN